MILLMRLIWSSWSVLGGGVDLGHVEMFLFHEKCLNIYFISYIYGYMVGLALRATRVPLVDLGHVAMRGGVVTISLGIVFYCYIAGLSPFC